MVAGGWVEKEGQRPPRSIAQRPAAPSRAAPHLAGLVSEIKARAEDGMSRTPRKWTEIARARLAP